MLAVVEEIIHMVDQLAQDRQPEVRRKAVMGDELPVRVDMNTQRVTHRLRAHGTDEGTLFAVVILGKRQALVLHGVVSAREAARAGARLDGDETPPRLNRRLALFV